ncbi:MAG: tetratricopeptide repeat protein [Muribaculaceae bacterium]|nr:tetratricopeptide repeat protein [Muribaculaceae bacterium]
MKRIIILHLLAFQAIFSFANMPFNFYGQKAEEAFGVGAVEDALDYAREEMKDYPDNPNGYFQAALSLYYLNQPGQALSLINRAIEKTKKDKSLGARCYLLKADLLKEAGDQDLTIQALADGLKLDSKNIDLLLEHAYSITISNPKGALKELQQAKKIAPNDPRVYASTAYLYTTQENYKEALDEVTRAIALNNTSAYNYGLRGSILKTLGYSPDWIQDCLQSIILSDYNSLGAVMLASPNDEATREEIYREIERTRSPSNGYYQIEADLLSTWGLYEEAERVYQEIIDLGIADESTYFYLADAQKRIGKLLDSYTSVSKGLSVYPNNPDLMFAKAQIGIDAGKGSEVIPSLLSLISLNPENSNLHFETGRAYLSIGRFAEACEPLATAVALDPSVANKIYYADALRLSGKEGKARDIYLDILKEGDEKFLIEGLTPAHVRALTYSGLGDKENTLKTISEYEKENPEEALSFLVQAFARLGMKDETIKKMREYDEKYSWNALLDLHSYDFFNFHPEPAFKDLLAERGIKTRFNPDSQLLELEFDEISFSSGGTSFQDMQNLSVSNPYELVREVNKICPVDMGYLGQLESVAYDDKNKSLIYNFITSPTAVNYEALENDPSYKEKKEEIIVITSFRDNPTFANSEYTFIYNLRNRENTHRNSYVFTPSKIKNINKKYESQDEIDKLTLEFWAEEEQMEMKNKPYSENVRISFDGKTYSFIYTIPETELTGMDLYQAEIKKSLKPFFKDLSLQSKLPIFIRQNIFLKFIYQGEESGRTIEIVFTPEDFIEFVK